MQNVLPTDMHIHEQYDLKGSTVNRSVRLAEKDDIGSIAQKDNDFQRKIVLGPKAQAFIEQIEQDCVVRACSMPDESHTRARPNVICSGSRVMAYAITRSSWASMHHRGRS